MDSTQLPLNEIPLIQNAEPQIRLLRARRYLYQQGKFLLIVQMCFVIGLPVIGSITTLVWPGLKALLAILSILTAILDTTLLDRWQRTIRRMAAKAAEQFDCVTLQLPWDQFTVGSRLDAEAIYNASSKHLSGNDDPTLLDWYPSRVRLVPIHFARIICQRTNLWYDAKLRWQYGRSVLALVILLNLVFLFIGIANQLTLDTFVLSFLAPATPVTIWGVREYFRQRDTAEAIDKLRTEAEQLWERAVRGECSEDECARLSRQFQNAIYERRSNSPIIFDWVYWRQRNHLEKQMNSGAEELLNQIVKLP